jgi:hypothetical protein
VDSSFNKCTDIGMNMDNNLNHAVVIQLGNMLLEILALQQENAVLKAELEKQHREQENGTN